MATKRFKLVEVLEIGKGYEVYISKKQVMELYEQLNDRTTEGFFIPMEKIK